VQPEQRPGIPPIIIEDYETTKGSETRELVQEKAPSNPTGDSKEVRTRPRSRSLIDLRSRLESEVRSLEKEQGRFLDEINSARDFEKEVYFSNKKLSALPDNRAVSKKLGERIMAERRQSQSVESLRQKILQEPGGQEFIEEHDNSYGRTPQSRISKKSSLERFEEKKQKAAEFLTKGAEKPGASHSGDESGNDDLKFDTLTENLPGRPSVNDRGEGGLSQALREEAARAAQMYPGLKNFRPGGRRSRSVSEGDSRRGPKVQPESWREQKNDDNDQPWPSREDPVW
jgi:hypothetical protein